MSGGTGHISKLARETALRNKQRRERINNYKKNISYYTNSNSTVELKFKEVSKKQLEELKQKYLLKLKKEKTKNNFILLLSICISIPLFVYIVKLFFNQIF